MYLDPIFCRKIKAYRLQHVKREVLNINYVIYTEITNLKTDQNNLVKIAEICLNFTKNVAVLYNI